MRTHRTAAATALAAALLTLTACSSSKPSPTPTTTAPPVTKTPTRPPTTPPTTPPTSPPTTPPTDATALKEAVQAYSTAYFKPDPKAGYALLSANCKAGTDENTYAAELTAATGTYGHQNIKTLKVDELSGDLARVTYTYSVPALDQSKQPWAREHGQWRYDGC